MEITTRGLLTLIHGMGFGALYLMACSGALVELYRHCHANAGPQNGDTHYLFLANYLTAMAAVAWLAVLSGTYIVYPWYRATPPAGTTDLAGFPQRLLMASPTTAGWHSIGMEWKEHVAWLVPIAITMAAAVCRRYGRGLKSHREMRTAVLGFVWASLLASGVAGFFGAMLNKNAPVQGGTTIRIMEGGEK